MHSVASGIVSSKSRRAWWRVGPESRDATHRSHLGWVIELWPSVFDASSEAGFAARLLPAGLTGQRVPPAR